MISMECAEYLNGNKTPTVLLKRNLDDDADVTMALGEMLYGVECQSRGFFTDSVFQTMKDEIPEKLSARKVSISREFDDIMLKVSFVKK